MANSAYSSSDAQAAIVIADLAKMTADVIYEESIASALLTTNKTHQSDHRSPNGSPVKEYGGILIKSVTFFRNDLYDFFATRFQADVFASAAYDCNKNHKPIVEKYLSGYDKPEKDIDYENGMKAKIRASCRAARENGNDALVFSAFGCGAFKNDPKIISQWYKEVFVEIEFQDVFKFVVFAIIPEDSQNFTAFQTCFSE